MQKVWLGLGFLFTVWAALISNEIFIKYSLFSDYVNAWNEESEVLATRLNFSECYEGANELKESIDLENSYLKSGDLLLETMGERMQEKRLDPYRATWSQSSPKEFEAECKESISQENKEHLESNPQVMFIAEVFPTSLGAFLLVVGASGSFLLYRKSL